mgnify:FL=1
MILVIAKVSANNEVIMEELFKELRAKTLTEPRCLL